MFCQLTRISSVVSFANDRVDFSNWKYSDDQFSRQSDNGEREYNYRLTETYVRDDDNDCRRGWNSELYS